MSDPISNAPQSVEDLKPLHYDPWLIPLGPLEALSKQIFQSLPQPPITLGRKPRADAMARREAALKSIIANLAAFHLSPAPRSGVAMPLRNSKKTRYDMKSFHADVLRVCVGGLHEAGLLDLTPGEYKKKRTTIAPSDALRERMETADVSLEHIGRMEGKETVILRTRRKGNLASEPLDYVDSSKTVSMRRDMETINAALNSISLEFDGVCLPPQCLMRIFTQPRGQEAPEFVLHGRLYDGFWQNLPGSLRYRFTIDGEEIADLDYKGMFLQLAYTCVGAEMPDGDPYAVPGIVGHRDTIKRLTNSLFFRDGLTTRFPRGVERLPSPWTMEKFIAAISALHPALVPLFGSEIGFELMFRESEAMVAVLLELAARGIVACPMHDGLLCRKTHRSVAVAVMEQVSLEKLGRTFQVVEKPVLRPSGK